MRIALIALLAFAQDRPMKHSLVFCCRADNDLYRALRPSAARFDTPEQAIDAASEAVLILADGYPTQTTPVEALAKASAKKLKVYIEFPAWGAPKRTRFERGVVASNFASLAPMSILSIPDCHFVPMEAANPHLVAARVAGYDTAVYGLPKTTLPLLFERDERTMVATTKLSHFVTGRFGPAESWRRIWKSILSWLGHSAELQWTPLVGPSYSAEESLPDDAEERAIRRGSEWFLKSRLIPHSSREEALQKVAKKPELPTPSLDEPLGDGSLGILEGYLSKILHDGSQMQTVMRRCDCIAESAMALSFDPSTRKIASNLLDYVYSHGRKGGRENPEHASFGLVAWGVTNAEWREYGYGDDNARVLLGTMAAAGLSKNDRWNEAIAQCLLANLRTTGTLGYRGIRISQTELSRRGWEPFFRGRMVHHSPHLEAYLWACYLWAYHHSGEELFLKRAKTAIKMTMQAYPNGWRWMNGIQQERARMILPLAWLVRVQDTAQHRDWLRRIVDDMLQDQHPSGAIYEELGPEGKGFYPAPKSNEAYGTDEAPLIQKNGDPVADLLYTINFAFLGLREAASATGDPVYRDAENKLARFFCRIQIKSAAMPELDGGFFRAFDFKRWEYFASNSDSGWGAWCIESGWTQAWIVSVLALRRNQTSLWDLTSGVDVKAHVQRLRPQMIPDRVLAESVPLQHAAVNKPVKLGTEFDERYTAGLTDGELANADDFQSGWQGYHGVDLNATVDLGEARRIGKVSARFLQRVNEGIFLPPSVQFEISEDGNTFESVAVVKRRTAEQEAGPLIETYDVSVDKSARYIRVQAKNLKTIPAWHQHAPGAEAWLFVDEILVDPK